MLDPSPARMHVDEFLAWAEGRPGRYELVHGRTFAMSPERLRHLEAKGAAYSALKAAIASSGVRCRALPDGATVRIDASTAFVPDVTVRCGPPLDGDTIAFVDPIIVVEVASPSTRSNDEGFKFTGYFSLSSVRHYLLIDPDSRVVVHHARDGAIIQSRIIASGPLRLDPPGLDLMVEDLLGPS